MPTMIETKDLTKRYNKKTVVDGLDMKVPAGSIYGFLGPNGAGKSTTMKMLLGLTHPQQGHIQIFGKTLNKKNRLEILKNIGSLIESPSYYGHLTGRENLEIVCTLKDAPKQEIDQVLGLVRMEGQQHKKACHYSLGMKQRLGLAAALLGHPHLLLLDEPTNSLDTSGVKLVKNIVQEERDRGATVVLSCHDGTILMELADDILSIEGGKLVSSRKTEEEVLT